MPELPEIAMLARHLRPRVVGRRITRVEILRARSLWGARVSRLTDLLLGQRITALSRRAKYLRFDLEGDDCFLVHLGMTGRLRIETTSARAPAAKHDVAREGIGAAAFHTSVSVK
jgi:formamidopyrimidine-DNA glycosylase